jgi:hypothetical protein
VYRTRRYAVRSRHLDGMRAVRMPTNGLANIGMYASLQRGVGLVTIGSTAAAIRAMERPIRNVDGGGWEPRVLRPDRVASRQYQRRYAQYCDLTTLLRGGPGFGFIHHV